MKKSKFISILSILFIILTAKNVFATDTSYVLQIVNYGETQNLENDHGYVSKTITSIDEETGEVTVQLKLSNTSTSEDTSSTKEVYDNTEIYLLVSENIANDEETFTQYINNIETLSSKIFAIDSNTKIGIVGMTGTIKDQTHDEDGNLVLGDDDERYDYGTEDNAEIVVEPTDDINVLIDNLKLMNSTNTSYYTNLQAAIKLANKSYSDNTNKILISLYDGVPDIAIGVCANVSYGGWLSEYSTAEEAIIAKHEKIASYTKSEILTLETNDVSFILLRPDDTSYDEEWYNTNTGEKILDFDGSSYVQEIYGTIDNPTYGTMYTYDEDTLDSIITENMYADVVEIIESTDLTISDANIMDDFPDEVLEYFDFEYVGEPSMGTVSNEIDSEANTITWNIGTISRDEEATLSYKLTLKDIENEELLDKVIALNEKAVLTYTGTGEESYTVTLENSPTVKLTSSESDSSESDSSESDGNDQTKDSSSESNNSNSSSSSSSGKTDDTTSSSPLPYTGASFAIVIVSIITLAIVVFTYKKMNYYKDIE